MGAKVLLISEDDVAGRIWAYSLQQHGIDVRIATDCEEVLDHRGKEAPDMLIVDLYGGRLNAADLCRSLRAEANIPILLLIPRPDEVGLLTHYAAGADECVVKPISPLVLLAKVKAWLRWSFTAPVDVLSPMHNDGLSLDPQSRRATATDGVPIRLSKTEFRLLHSFMTHPNHVLETGYLINLLWGSDHGDATMLKNVVYHLRKKLQPHYPNVEAIQTVPGRGYCFSSR